ncbi:MAG TPA: MBOAT family O-acyltransferase [Verrucomicrobiota bacterium]|nr:MBOAT family O-acyltransferase [Verrucomicrobiota bacterium]
MLFVSWSFAVFLPIVFALHYWSRRLGWQVGVLTLASFVFYGWANPRLIPLLAIACLVNSIASVELLGPGRTPRRRRRVLLWALVFNLGALAFFKYAALLGHLLLPDALWARWGPWLSSIPLPVGISFFTFQGISLVVDAWYAGSNGIPGLPPPTDRRAVAVHFGKVTFFKAFFPQLIAGPIVKAGQFFYQIGPKRLADVNWDGAIKTLILGFFLKMVVADNLKEVTAAIRYPEFLQIPRLNLIALVYAFSFQLLADFAGYSIIAIGLARLFGYELPINFNFPYLSRSITEFWRRWHMTLSSWLREYLYIPMGGSRRGEWITYRNLFVVMFLGGLWHGAAWSYAVWGTAHGVLLAGERFFLRQHRAPIDDRWTTGAAIRALAIFTVVTFLWLLFQLKEFKHALEYLRCIGVNGGTPQPQPLFVIGLFSLPVIGWHLWAAIAERRRTWSASCQNGISVVAHSLMLFLIITNSGPPGEFIYFQF